MSEQEQAITGADVPDDFKLGERMGPIIERVHEEVDAMCPDQDVGIVLVVRHRKTLKIEGNEIHVMDGLETAATMPRQKSAKLLAQAAVKLMDSLVNEIPDDEEDDDEHA
jgi:hypothetical protein